MRVADLIAYVNHDIDDATRAGLLQAGGSAARAGRSRSAHSSSARIGDAGQGRRHRDAGRRPDRDPDERRRCSRRCSSCAASCSRRSTRTPSRRAEFKKAAGILSGLWEKVRERPDEFLDPRTIEQRRARRRRPRLRRRHDRPLRRPPLRAAVHPQALGDRLMPQAPDASVAALIASGSSRTR